MASRPPARRTAQAAVAAARPTVLRRPLAVLCRSPPRPRAPRAWARGVSVRFPSLILPWYKLVSARSRSASRRGRRPVRIEGPRRRRIGDLNIAWRLAYGRRRFRVGARFLSLVGIGTGNWGARDCRGDSCSAQHWCDVFQSDSHSGTHFDVYPRRTLRPASTVGDNQEHVIVKRDTMRERESATS